MLFFVCSRDSKEIFLKKHPTSLVRKVASREGDNGYKCAGSNTKRYSLQSKITNEYKKKNKMHVCKHD